MWHFHLLTYFLCKYFYSAEHPLPTGIDVGEPLKHVTPYDVNGYLGRGH